MTERLWTILAVFGLLMLPPATVAAQQAAAVSTQERIQRTPANASLPTIFIVGDSTADFSVDRNNEGLSGVQGWGVFLPAFFDATKVNVVNDARGGRSSRTFQTQGFWDQVLALMKPRDLVLIQIGQNDVFPINDATRARGTLSGIGPETQEIDYQLTLQRETVHTYGWYLRKYVADAKAKGAIPIVMSLTPRNVWKNGHPEVGVGQYREWAHSVAEQEHVAFVDVSAIIASQFEKFGQAKVNGLFHQAEPVHMTTPGSFMAAECTLAGLKSLPDSPVLGYLSELGRLVPNQADLAKPTISTAR